MRKKDKETADFTFITNAIFLQIKSKRATSSGLNNKICLFRVNKITTGPSVLCIVESNTQFEKMCFGFVLFHVNHFLFKSDSQPAQNKRDWLKKKIWFMQKNGSFGIKKSIGFLFFYFFIEFLLKNWAVFFMHAFHSVLHTVMVICTDLKTITLTHIAFLM